ncbi:DMT family transporter [Lutimaribacter sp. EGI FJ00015]|uniref:DMT family transporter n=1 Tax=Lutimaribacter degradans TaxID=2945989 RepID=A0ACC5ZUQ0_9RHOB|nr:DMT family transporter [Lutimaribacter sp. EGI FJ00013]MCM2561119.1 DMT family transporter [Lutimaribacter sp. EGI FJ00013]MCO0611932.1 DMT family transporter [Lutimaribacter sp. EGI FJ00015]MCO0634947.1 DMT family transporter [Lutimaribacter sp. EGI FJ00014]
MENLRGATVMVVAMAAFALEDMFIKWLAVDMSTGQILMLLGAGGALVFAVLARRGGGRLLSADFRTRAVILRNTGEVIGTMGFVTAIALTPLSSASAILQATPLAVTLGAAIFLNETVGWRRWSAILVGFCGVLLIIRPGLDGFEPASLFAVQGVIGLAIRDLATRAVPRTIGAMQLSFYAFALLVPTGLVLLLVQGHSLVPLEGAHWLKMAGALLLGLVGYHSIVSAMRLGEVAVVTPFRYSRLIFAILIGVAVFGERPDALTLTGAALIVASGLYTLVREARIHRRAVRAARAAR